MRQQLASDDFIKDGDLKMRCRKIVENEDFLALIRVAYSRLGPYRLSLDFSEEQHIQDRIDGGRAAVFAFVKELMTLPYKENLFVDPSVNQFVDPIEAMDATLV